MERDKIKFQLHSLSIRRAAKALNVSYSTLRYWIGKHNICVQRPENKKQICCRVCGTTDKNAFFNSVNKSGKKSPACKACNAKETILRYRRYKEEAVAYKGGKCCVCGYSKCMGSLEFHHTNPNEKDAEWALKIKNKITDNVKEELDKCILVCRNCHQEIHFNEFNEN